MPKDYRQRFHPCVARIQRHGGDMRYGPLEVTASKHLTTLCHPADSVKPKLYPDGKIGYSGRAAISLTDDYMVFNWDMLRNDRYPMMMPANTIQTTEVMAYAKLLFNKCHGCMIHFKLTATEYNKAWHILNDFDLGLYAFSRLVERRIPASVELFHGTLLNFWMLLPTPLESAVRGK